MKSWNLRKKATLARLKKGSFPLWKAEKNHLAMGQNLRYLFSRVPYHLFKRLPKGSPGEKGVLTAISPSSMAPNRQEMLEKQEADRAAYFQPGSSEKRRRSKRLRQQRPAFAKSFVVLEVYDKNGRKHVFHLFPFFHLEGECDGLAPLQVESGVACSGKRRSSSWPDFLFWKELTDKKDYWVAWLLLVWRRTGAHWY